MTPQERHYVRLGRPERLHLPPPEPLARSLRGLILTAAVTLTLAIVAVDVVAFVVEPPALTEVPK